MKKYLSIIFFILLAIDCHAQMADNSKFEYTPELKQRADQGDPKSMFRMGYIYYHGPNSILCPNSKIGVNAAMAVKYLKAAAQKGEPDAQYWFGNVYFYGVQGMAPVDYKQAEYWFLKAAKGGNIDAYINLAMIYQTGGNGVEASDKKAFEMNLKAANLGNAIAQYNLSVIYNWGQLGVAANGEECVKWLRKAAAQNYENALIDLGILYLNGSHVELDPEQGIKWFYKATNMGSARAWCLLGECYSLGQGVSQDFKKAAICYYRSMEKGFDRKTALTGLEKCYQQGVYSAASYSSLDLWVQHLGQLITQYDAKQKAGNASKVEVVDIVDSNVPKTNRECSKTFAVIIGNEHYQKVAAVPYANNDAATFAKYCQYTLGIPALNIRQYKDLTYAGFLTAIEDLGKIAEAFGNDIHVIFYYAGHGIPDEKTMASYLLPVDANGSNTTVCYKLADLYDSLSKLNAKSVVVLLDACFSGAQRGEGMLSSARGVAIKSKPSAPKGNMTVFSAACGDETAYPYKEKKHGLFTYFLLKKLQDTNGNVTLGDLTDYVTSQVRQQSILVNKKSQTPQVTVSGIGGDKWKTNLLGE